MNENELKTLGTTNGDLNATLSQLVNCWDTCTEEERLKLAKEAYQLSNSMYGMLIKYDSKADVDKKGDEKVPKKNPYSFLFDCGSACWNTTDNLIFLKAQERYFTQKLITHKRVFLSEVLDALGIYIQDEETFEFAHTHGWTYGEGDNFVDFGLHECEDGDYCLNFNCDGYMFKRSNR